MRTPAPGRPMARNDAGFTMLAVLIAVAVINIALGVATVRWSTYMKRQREVELVWRGEQYARALGCYQQEHERLPTELEELLEARCIRHLYADPVSRSGRWQVIRVADVAPEDVPSFGGAGAGEAAVPAGGTQADTSLPTARGLRERSGAPASDSGGRGSFGGGGGLADRLRARAKERRGRTRRSGAPGSREDAMDQIVGVVSTSSAEALAEREGKRRYDEWRFMAGSAPPVPIPTWVPETLPQLPGLEAEEPDTGPSARGLRSRQRDSGGTPE